MLGLQTGHHLLDVPDVLGLDDDVARGAADPAGRLVHHDPRVRQRVPLAPGSGGEQELRGAPGEADRDGRDGVGQEAQRVVHGEAGADRSAGELR
nr:hypothetical protein GCM10025730_39680 [Promicromonospora thailandica]